MALNRFEGKSMYLTDSKTKKFKGRVSLAGKDVPPPSFLKLMSQKDDPGQPLNNVINILSNDYDDFKSTYDEQKSKFDQELIRFELRARALIAFQEINNNLLATLGETKEANKITSRDVVKVLTATRDSALAVLDDNRLDLTQVDRELKYQAILDEFNNDSADGVHWLKMENQNAENDYTRSYDFIADNYAKEIAQINGSSSPETLLPPSEGEPVRALGFWARRKQRQAKLRTNYPDDIGV